ncbi:polysaccharide biosynthesis/export family protein [Maricaulaceae bacterium MS644]
MTRLNRRQALTAFAAVFVAGCAGRASQPATASFEPSRFQAWNDAAPAYRLYPGDTVEVTVHTANELSGPRDVGPDGRVNLPLAGAVMVSGKTAPEAAREMAGRYASVLRDPIVEVRPQSFGSQRILVGGEVNDPGLYEMPSARIGVLEALLLAGGPTSRARRRRIAVLRRAEDGGVMLREVDIASALEGGRADMIPLQRHDIVFAPRSGIAEVNDFVEQYVRNILPIDAAFSYALADSLFND